MKKILWLWLLLLCLRPFTAQATHIVGGELFYDNLGNNSYKITLKLYRDCLNGQAPYDNPAWVFIFNSSGVMVDSVGIPFPGSTVLPPVINYPCFIPPTNICVEEAIYTTTVTLPPITGGYDITYQRCCRNNTILNLINPGSVGTTYTAHIPDPSIAAINSSPRYNFFPPIYLCAGAPLSFDNSAIDPDGDSLVYSLCDAYTGASACCPILGPTAFPTSGPNCPNPPPSCPFIAPAPPYSFVPYLSPYSGSYPMSSSPALTINPVNGLLTGTPNMIGQWVVAVCVSEYRHGVLLDVHKRDFQFNVTACTPLTVSSFPSQQTFCFGYNVNFLNNSQNATTYLWNFGDPNAHPDTSNLFTPSHTYSDSGVYHVTLICNPHTLCADTAVTTFYIYPLLKPSFARPSPQCANNNSFSFTAGGSFLGNGTFSWTFPGANPSSSSQRNPSGIHYLQPGTYPVTLTVSENSCTQTYSDSVQVLAPPTLNYTMNPVSGCPDFPVAFSFPPLNPLLNPVCTWNFGDGGTSQQLNPTHIYSTTGTYAVTLQVITTTGCLDTFNFSIPLAVTAYPLPEANFTADSLRKIQSDPVVHFTDLSTGGNSCYWNFGDGSILTACQDTFAHFFPNAGLYNVMEIVTNSYGCKDTLNLAIDIYPIHYFWIPNAFTPNGDGLNDLFKPVIEGVTDLKFMIFDRWGELIYSSTGDEGWNGTYKGNKCQEDVYVWKIQFTNVVTQGRENYIGRVTLVR